VRLAGGREASEEGLESAGVDDRTGGGVERERGKSAGERARVALRRLSVSARARVGGGDVRPIASGSRRHVAQDPDDRREDNRSRSRVANPRSTV
jgi:hypothetical protein